jgi:diguanylate cyclase (GGDEF)-like protein
VADLIAPEQRVAFEDMHAKVIGGTAAELEFEVIGLKGGRRWLETHAVPMQDHGQTVHLAVTRDITRRKEMEDKVRQLAFHDVLTQLPNRRLLLDRLSQAMVASERNGRFAAVLFLDLDNFKPLNDAHGHEMGDLLLIEVGQRLRSCVREIDTVSRFGGDEFVVMLSDLDNDRAESVAQARAVAEKIRQFVAKPYRLAIQQGTGEDSTVTHHCSASIGVAVFQDHEGTEEEVIAWADKAMYKAKEAGRNQICVDDSRSTMASAAQKSDSLML